MSEPQLLIVGAGRTGLVLALWLAKVGVPFRLIDRKAGSVLICRNSVAQPSRLCLKTHNRDGCATKLGHYRKALPGDASRGLEENAVYLVRPDGYIGFAGAAQDAEKIHDYLIKFSIVAKSVVATVVDCSVTCETGSLADGN